MRFAKMHGLGNDFVMVNGFKEKLPKDLNTLAKTVCHRQLGIGANGLIILQPSQEDAIAQFLIFNDDGSQAEMCGNGIRCAAVFAKMEGITKKNDFIFETLGGMIEPTIIDEENSIIRVDMGKPRLMPSEIPAKFVGTRVVSAPLMVHARMFNITLVNMGNPHCVIFVDDVDELPVKKIGPQIENNPLFPEKTNVEFIQLMGGNKLKMRVWERGCGITPACGTGACAATVAAVLNGYIKDCAEVVLEYGSLDVEWAINGHVYLTGPAVYVAEGSYQID
jgi:diaminopimelate epimerase